MVFVCLLACEWFFVCLFFFGGGGIFVCLFLWVFCCCCCCCLFISLIDCVVDCFSDFLFSLSFPSFFFFVVVVVVAGRGPSAVRFVSITNSIPISVDKRVADLQFKSPRSFGENSTMQRDF